MMRSPWRSRKLPPRKEVQEVVKSANAFAFQAMQVLAERDKDFLFSPLSAYVSLALTPSLFVGQTRAEILKALGCQPRQKFSEFSARVQTLIESEEDERLSLYSTVVTNSNLNWPPNAFNVLDSVLRYRIVNMPFPEPACETVNDCCEKATHGSIQSIIDPSEISQDDSCILVSTLWFEDEWDHPFTQPRTIDWHHLDGSITQVDGMYEWQTHVSYLKKGNIESLGFDYRDDRTMIIMLPATVADFNPAIVTEEFFNEHFPKKGYTGSFLVTLPKWSLETGVIDVKPVCESFGVHRLFECTNDGLEGVSSYCIPEFIQKLTIHVSERGTVAGAVNRMVRYISGVPGVFVADRPFYYMIFNKTTKVIEFIGCVVDPKFSPDAIPRLSVQSEHGARNSSTSSPNSRQITARSSRPASQSASRNYKQTQRDRHP